MSNNEEAYFLERRCNEEIEHVIRAVYATGAKLAKDGNMWCYLLGKNIQDGVCGFGTTPMEAANNFFSEYMKVKP